MKLLTLLFFSLFISTTPIWLTDFDQAKNEAGKNGKLILINFSGSDWCGPCIRMHRDFFTNEEFNKYAELELVLVKADFPRSQKNRLSKEQEQKNELLADKYNKDGKFPYTVLTNADGNVLKVWEGFPKETPIEFIQEIKAFENAGN